MAGDGTTYTIDIPVRGGSEMESAADAAARLAKELGNAKASYAQAETNADKAAKAVEKVGVAIESQRGKMADAMKVGNSDSFWKAAAAVEKLTQQQAKLQANSNAAKAALEKEAASLDSISKAEAKAKKDAEAFQKAQGSGKLNEIAEGFGKLGGPLGQLGQKTFGAAEGVKKLMSSLGSGEGLIAVIGVGVAALAAAVVALGVAVVAGAIALGSWAIGLADAARTSTLLADGIAQSVEGGERLNDQFDDLENTFPIAREEITRMASDLAKTGLKGEALGNALEAAALKASKAKFGPDWQKQMISLDSSTARFKRGISGLFSGLKIEPLLEKLAQLVDLFDENNAAGRAIKVVFETIFQPIVDGLTGLIPKARTAFIQFEILCLKALIALAPYKQTILDTVDAVGTLAAITVGGLALGFAVVTAAIVETVAVLGTLIKFGSDVVSALVGAGKQIVSFFETFSLADIGKNMIDGLISGITNAGPRVLESVKGIATGAADAAKKALGIASPSKVFAEIGVNTAEGMSQGVDSGAGDVQSSVQGLVAPPDAAAAGASGSSGITVYISVEANGDGDSIAAKVREAVLDVFAQTRGQLGVGVPANA